MPMPNSCTTKSFSKIGSNFVRPAPNFYEIDPSFSDPHCTSCIIQVWIYILNWFLRESREAASCWSWSHVQVVDMLTLKMPPITKTSKFHLFFCFGWLYFKTCSLLSNNMLQCLLNTPNWKKEVKYVKCMNKEYYTIWHTEKILTYDDIR